MADFMTSVVASPSVTDFPAPVTRSPPARQMVAFLHKVCVQVSRDGPAGWAIAPPRSESSAWVLKGNITHDPDLLLPEANKQFITWVNKAVWVLVFCFGSVCGLGGSVVVCFVVFLVLFLLVDWNKIISATLKCTFSSTSPPCPQSTSENKLIWGIQQNRDKGTHQNCDGVKYTSRCIT